MENPKVHKIAIYVDSEDCWAHPFHEGDEFDPDFLGTVYAVETNEPISDGDMYSGKYISVGEVFHCNGFNKHLKRIDMRPDKDQKLLEKVLSISPSYRDNPNGGYEYTCPFCSSYISVGGDRYIVMDDIEHEPECAYLLAKEIHEETIIE